MEIFSYHAWKITNMGQVKNIHQHVPFRWLERYQLIEIRIWLSFCHLLYQRNKGFWIGFKEKVSKINFQHYEDASKEIRESVKAIEAEEADSGDEMNDDDDDVVLL